LSSHGGSQNIRRPMAEKRSDHWILIEVQKPGHDRRKLKLCTLPFYKLKDDGATMVPKARGGIYGKN